MDGLDLTIAFSVTMATVLATGYFVFSTDSMARAGLLLLASLGLEGLVFLMLANEFLGVLMLLMMAGEMVIMVFFMVMFMADPGGWVGMDMTHQKRIAGSMAVLGATGLGVLTALTGWPGAAAAPVVTVTEIGLEIMGRGMFVFLMAGVTILVAMVGATMMARQGGRLELPAPGDQGGDDEDPS